MSSTSCRGLVAVTSGSFFTVKAEYLSGADPSGWGWAHLVLGVVAAVAGAARPPGLTAPAALA